MISPQDTFDHSGWPYSWREPDNNRLSCSEPAYNQFLPPARTRRMGRMLKMAIVSAAQCLEKSGLSHVDGISCGTGLGCLEDTERFLLAMIRDEEKYLTPTHFIQSLQNAVSAQVALYLNCQAHNYTFVHKGHSFQSALIDGIMLLNEAGQGHVLVGGMDEITDLNFDFYKRLGWIKEKEEKPLNILTSETKGSIGGENCAFFVLGAENEHVGEVAIKDIHIWDTDNEDMNFQEGVSMITKRNGWSKADIDLYILGFSGDRVNDEGIHKWMEHRPIDAHYAHYKHMSGEYPTDASFALWMAYTAIRQNHLPGLLSLSGQDCSDIRRVMIITNYQHFASIVLLEDSNLESLPVGS